MRSVLGAYRSKFSIKLAAATFIGITLLFFQNCGQSGSIGAKDGTVYNDEGVATFPSYSSKSISSSEAPPLKIVFLMDNSNSMTLNNLNLQQSLSSMFDNQANDLSQFNADIYFYTTAQLSALAGSFALQTRTPASFAGNTLSDIENNIRGPASFTGLIAGDLLGFETRRTTTSQLDLIEYTPQPVVAFRDNGGRQILPSIRYTKGSSIETLKANVKERLDIISPDRASQLSDASVFSVLDTESAMCGLARILKNPGQTILPGDIASFVIVSDENEADPQGTNCLTSKRREYLYRATCEQRVPASTVPETTVHYQTRPGTDQYKTTFQLRTPDQIKNMIATTLKLTRSEKNAICNGTQQREFDVNYQIVQKTYFINYSKKPLIGTREGNVPIYGTEQTGLKTSNQSGLIPGDCQSNISTLRSIIGDTTSALTIQSCSQNPDTNQSQPTVRKTYAAYPSVNLNNSTTCPSALITELSSNGTRQVVNCSLSARTEYISSSALSAAGFPSQGTLTHCQSAVATVCQNNTQLRNCNYTGFTAAVSADTKVSVPVTEASSLNCNALCSKFSDLCSAGSTQTVQQYAAANGYSCSVTTAASSQTYTISGVSNTVSVTGTSIRNCDSTCSAAPSACGNTSGTQTISQYNQSCSSSSILIPGSSPQSLALNPVQDDNQSINCSTICSQSNGVCGGSLTIAQYISQNLNGENCSVTRANRSINETVKTSTVTRIKQSDLNSNYCPGGYEKSGSPTLTSSYEDSSETVSGTLNLSDFILTKLNSTIGAKGATLTAFITPQGASNSGLSTSYGQAYENLVKAWKSGTVSDIRSPSYAPALTQLSATLKSRLIRSVLFSEVTGNKKIRQVWHHSKNNGNWRLLPANEWSATGGTVTVDDSVELDFEDQLKIEYY